MLFAVRKERLLEGLVKLPSYTHIIPDKQILHFFILWRISDLSGDQILNESAVLSVTFIPSWQNIWQKQLWRRRVHLGSWFYKVSIYHNGEEIVVAVGGRDARAGGSEVQASSIAL